MSCGASANSRARPSDSRSPRFDVTSECSSSSTTRRSEPNRYGASARGEQQRKLLRRGEQDVGRIAALALALRGRRVAGAGFDAGSAGPSRRPAFRGCARCRPRAPSAARCRACAGRLRGARRGRWRSELARPQCVRRSAQLDQRRQEARQRLAAAGRRDQQRERPALRLRQQFELMRARRQPRAANQRAKTSGSGRRLVSNRSRRTVRMCQCVATTIRPGTGTPFSVRVEAESRLTSCQARPPRSLRGRAPRHARSAAFAPSDHALASHASRRVKANSAAGREHCARSCAAPARDRRNRRTHRRRARDDSARRSRLAGEECARCRRSIEPVVETLRARLRRPSPATDRRRPASRHDGRNGSAASPVPQPRSSIEPKLRAARLRACTASTQQRGRAISQAFGQRRVEARRILVEQRAHIAVRHGGRIGARRAARDAARRRGDRPGPLPARCSNAAIAPARSPSFSRSSPSANQAEAKPGASSSACTSRSAAPQDRPRPRRSRAHS